ncbi:HD domain-containing protein [Carboxydothermus ferrireducens]|uniref:Endogenous inhibitor of DNA gyrase (YacG/DUF329 family) n=1 Tax=Carboxydothermus ferrireducens DSM 11255 TaxID=1119529 RepID=A0ABX2RDB7_9THEO|nr:HD domain-containing protein [Carboxydothermus ferrireducens]NYE57818.1 endogenous inhibitor of DNA gyrase (YacG/DUF329 family) [Carboxydothermus ferrireducens DSM 11255]
MGMWKCPGQDRSFWKIDDIFEAPCPHCGEMIEFWKDDITIKCPHCKNFVTNPKFNPGCAAWCNYADKCLGAVAQEIQSQPEIVKTRVEVNVRKYLFNQPELLGLSLKAGEYAEKLAEKLQVSPLVPVVAAYFHKITESSTRQELARKAKLPEEAYAAVEKLLAGEGEAKELNIFLDAVRLAALHHKTTEELEPEFNILLSELSLAEARDFAQKIFDIKKKLSKKK